jgi:hypothetical protein
MTQQMCGRTTCHYNISRYWERFWFWNSLTIVCSAKGEWLLLSPSSGFESFVHFSSLKSLFMIYLAHIVVNSVDIGHIMSYAL